MIEGHESNTLPPHMTKPLHTIIDTLSKPAILNFILPVLMLYLVTGTIAQKYIGLYQATHIFFSDPLIWLGFIPLPGLPILLTLMSLNLFCKLIFKSPWIIKNAGIILTHIAALLLLVGGLITALYSQEGYIDLPIHNSKNIMQDYHIRNLVISDQNGNEILNLPHSQIKVGQNIKLDNKGVNIKILEYCTNCKINARTVKDDEIYYSMAMHMTLTEDKPRLKNEENMAGLTFKMTGTHNDGVYVVLEHVNKIPVIETDENTYSIQITKQETQLPFSIELIDFTRDMHPGTQLAKAYASRVRITDGPSVWESEISMNQPLRYKGYTLFQSSFIPGQEQGDDISVLAVVHNAGRAFPYISGLTMCFGMLLHLFVRRSKKKNSSTKAKTA